MSPELFTNFAFIGLKLRKFLLRFFAIQNFDLFFTIIMHPKK